MGDLYAVLYDKKLEVYKTDSDEPVSQVTSDINFVSMEFISQNEIITADNNGKFTLVKGIEN